MALFSVKNQPIPPGFVSLSKSEAVDFQLGLIETLSPKAESWSILYGGVVSGAGVGFSSVYFHNYYRSSIKILNFRRMRTIIPIVLLPTSVAFFLHNKLVRDNIIIQKWSCPVCYHLRSSLLQVFWGIFFPGVLSVVTTCVYARRFQLADVPPMNHWKTFWPFLKETTRPAYRLFGLFIFGQFALGAALAHMEAKQNNEFNSNFELLRQKYDRTMESE